MSTPRFRKLAERVAFEGSLISVAEGTFEGPGGGRFQRDIVHHPGAVSVVPVTGEGRVLMVRQYRAAVDRELLEIPAGKRDVAGEDPVLTARRELAEEVGMEAAQMVLLGEFYNSPGFCDEHSFVYLATGLSPCPLSAQGEEEEHMTIEEIALDEVPALVADRSIVDAKSIIGLCLARAALA
ncbi:MAG: NUDIX hydrolase [Actinomycetota bacterium]